MVFNRGRQLNEGKCQKADGFAVERDSLAPGLDHRNTVMLATSRPKHPLGGDCPRECRRCSCLRRSSTPFTSRDGPSARAP